jgi:DNA-binding LacI/PurR family transcriptional regulator
MVRVRLEDVARLAGVSMKTVSNVVHRHPHVSASTRDRVQQAIDELGYRPNAVGRRLATGRTGILAFAFCDVGLPYFAELVSVVYREAAARGYRLLLEQTSYSVEEERAVLTGGESALVDGILFQPSVISAAELAELRTDVPVVLLGERAAPITVDHVMIDNVAAAAEVTMHLAALGRRRIGFLGHEPQRQSETSRQRLLGYQRGLEQAGLGRDMSLLVARDEVTAAGAAQALGAALDAGLAIDALVCRDDLAAAGALRALHERGFAMPEEVAVTGWDDVQMASYTHPTLTTVAPDTTELVRVALDLLEERVAGYDGLGRHRVTPYEVRFRESAPAVAVRAVAAAS